MHVCSCTMTCTGNCTSHSTDPWWNTASNTYSSRHLIPYCYLHCQQFVYSIIHVNILPVTDPFISSMCNNFMWHCIKGFLKVCGYAVWLYFPFFYDTLWPIIGFYLVCKVRLFIIKLFLLFEELCVFHWFLICFPVHYNLTLSSKHLLSTYQWFTEDFGKWFSKGLTY